MSQDVSRSMGASARLAWSFLLGLAVALILVVAGRLRYAPLAGWDTLAIVFTGTSLLTVLPFDAAATRSHALRENPGRAAADVLLVVTSLASIAAVAVLLVLAHKTSGVERNMDIGLGLFSIVVSWAVVHTVFMLKYARLYYGHPEGGIDFNDRESPRYLDFAYLAFTVGMTFQVSDTDLQTKTIRTTVLRQALLAYVFGTVIIAVTINTLASLSL
ncbi:MAG TPA: DUF1345 domain-containing protein [Candidatus Saccharimonadales bacterium]